MTRSTVAAVIVTHQSARWISETLESVRRQSQPPDRIVVVDDASTDQTRELIAHDGIEVIVSATQAGVATTRIAQNFVQGVLAVLEADLVVLGDHDDIWHPNRVERQVALLEGHPEALMVASDGCVVDAEGTPTGAHVRDAFPIPPEWDEWSAAERMKYGLRHSVATGGASMLRPAAFPELSVPEGWLHDRWWSLMSLARDGLVVDRECVIRYRVQGDQQVGLNVASQGSGSSRRLASLVSDGSRSVSKYRDLRESLRPIAADPEVARQITLRNVLGT
jgi:glycosyltransferase involved in cell wall biosynthesis